MTSAAAELTRADWINALYTPRRVTVQSHNALVDAVNALPASKSATAPAKRATVAAEVAPAREVWIQPTTLLHDMGRISSPRSAVLTDLCSTWARIRYIWAFAPSDIADTLRLSDEAQAIDVHQKTLFSDELGVGMAAYVMRECFQAGKGVDVDVVLRKGIIPGLRQTQSACPDYIFEDLNQPDVYRIVECKGTQSGRRNALLQLKRGTEQVRSLSFENDPQPILSYVVATAISPDETVVYVIDPPGAGPRGSRDLRLDANEAGSFRRALAETQDADLLRYAGDLEAAERIERFRPDRSPRPRRQRRPLAEIRTPDVDESFIGTQQTVGIIGEAQTITVFQGIAGSIYRALVDDARVTSRALQMRFQETILSELPSVGDQRLSRATVQRGTETLTVRSYHPDGSLLQIDVRV